jgi:hypothetical protein
MYLNNKIIKYKIHQLKRQIRAEKSRIKRKKYLKYKNLLKETSTESGKKEYKNKTGFQKIPYKVLPAPAHFSLFDYPDLVIGYIESLKNIHNKYKTETTIHINLSKVIEVDVAAINMILSAIQYISIRKYNIRGNLPLNEKAKSLFFNSVCGPYDEVK